MQVRSTRDTRESLAQLAKNQERKQRLKPQTAEADAADPLVGEGLPPVPFERYFWRGQRPEGEPDDGLKKLRKQLGIKLRGSPAPAPIDSFVHPGLPDTFTIFQKARAAPGKAKFEKPTPVQAQVWPSALCGLDVIAIAPTGSGKTLAYILPAVAHILGQKENTGKPKGPSCVTLVPTRELAQQVCDACGGNGGAAWLQKSFGLRAGAIYGGVGKEMQVDGLLSLGCPSIVSATPGRLLDLLALGVFSLQSCSYLVLDEADRMLQLGFEPQLVAVVKQIRENRQVLLFSATFPMGLRTAAERWMSKERVLIRVGTMEVDEEQETGGNTESTPSASSTLSVSPTVKQTLHVCAEHKKAKKLAKFFAELRAAEREAGARQRAAALVFCTQIKTLRAVEKFLWKCGERCAALHSGIPQDKREQALADLKVGKLDTVVATDVASRGLHISRLRHVVNYDFPPNLESYCHRIGRVGRNGADGFAFSFFTRNFAPLAPGLVSLLERSKQAVDPNLRALAEGREPADADPASGKGDAEDTQPASTEGDTAEATDLGAAKPKKSEPFTPGSAVQLHSLRATELNGLSGVVRRRAESGRWEVAVEAGLKALLEKNLTSIAAPTTLGPGCRVCLHGLKATELNGLPAKVVRKLEDRWELVMDKSHELKAIKPANLRVTQDQAQPGSGPAETSKQTEQQSEPEPSSDSDVPAEAGLGGGIRIKPAKRSLDSDDAGKSSKSKSKAKRRRKRAS